MDILAEKLAFSLSDLYFTKKIGPKLISFTVIYSNYHNKNFKEPNKTSILGNFWLQNTIPTIYYCVCYQVVLVITQPLYWLLHLFWMKSSWDLRTKKPRVLIQKRYLNILVSCWTYFLSRVKNQFWSACASLISSLSLSSRLLFFWFLLIIKTKKGVFQDEFCFF